MLCYLIYISKRVLWVPVCSFLREMGPNGHLIGKGCRHLPLNKATQHKTHTGSTDAKTQLAIAAMANGEAVLSVFPANYAHTSSNYARSRCHHKLQDGVECLFQLLPQYFNVKFLNGKGNSTQGKLHSSNFRIKVSLSVPPLHPPSFYDPPPPNAASFFFFLSEQPLSWKGLQRVVMLRWYRGQFDWLSPIVL